MDNIIIFLVMISIASLIITTNAYPINKYFQVSSIKRNNNLSKKTSLNLLEHHISSQIIAVGDYAEEIEKAVGTEVYTPIFQAGLFIFVSGLISSLIAAFIISKSNTWEGLEEEFQLGKESQFIDNKINNQEDIMNNNKLKDINSNDNAEDNDNNSSINNSLKDLDI